MNYWSFFVVVIFYEYCGAFVSDLIGPLLRQAGAVFYLGKGSAHSRGALVVFCTGQENCLTSSFGP